MQPCGLGVECLPSDWKVVSSNPRLRNIQRKKVGPSGSLLNTQHFTKGEMNSCSLCPAGILTPNLSFIRIEL